MKLLVTGGCGFIGSAFIRMALGHEWADIINLDALTYAGTHNNLEQIHAHHSYQFVEGNICDRELVRSLLSEGVDTIVNFAAETHVDRSIADPGIFIRTNVDGTLNLLECAREAGIKRFIQISTDEVYGALAAGDPAFTEHCCLKPNSPYAASKAAGDMLCRSYYQTYGLPVVVTRCSNNYGPHQHPEKLIPLMITNAAAGKPLPVYGDGRQIRDWIHVDDHCRGIQAVIENGLPGEIYNIGGNNEKRNITIIKQILNYLDKSEALIEHVSDRPGHDRRYAINSTRVQVALGWQPVIPFDQGLIDTIKWYQSQND